MSKARGNLRQRLFARFLRLADSENQRRYGERRRRLLGPLRGRVLELGPGTGVNFEALSPEIHWVGIEPNPSMHPHLEEKAAAEGRAIEIRREFPGPDENDSYDAVVSTLVLCSVKDPAALLRDVLRVLRPGGVFVFIEHVISPVPGLRRFAQRSCRFTPWSWFADGCDPARDLSRLIEDAGFAQVELERFDQIGRDLVSALIRPHVSGIATKSTAPSSR